MSLSMQAITTWTKSSRSNWHWCYSDNHYVKLFKTHSLAVNQSHLDLFLSWSIQSVINRRRFVGLICIPYPVPSVLRHFLYVLYVYLASITRSTHCYESCSCYWKESNSYIPYRHCVEKNANSLKNSEGLISEEFFFKTQHTLILVL